MLFCMFVGVNMILFPLLQMNRIVIDDAPDSAEAYNRPASLMLGKKLGELEAVNEEINKILSPAQLIDKEDQKPEVENLSSSSTIIVDSTVPGVTTTGIDIKHSQAETSHEGETSNLPGSVAAAVAAEPVTKESVDVEMEEKQEDNSGPEIIVMD